MNSYTCAICKETYEKGWSEEEALEELKRNFNMDNTDDCVLVCDDCYKNLPLPH